MNERSFDESAEEAARWFAKMRRSDVSLRQRTEFAEWRATEENSRAYADCEAAWEEIRGAASDPAIMAMRREALALGQPARAVSAKWMAGLAALAASIVLVFFALPTFLSKEPTTPRFAEAPIAALAQQQTYRTKVGERARVNLADGSEVVLNTDSELRIDFSQRIRRMSLIKGQAFFDVAHDEDRPFVVEAAGRSITALGTEFDVNLAGDELTITLIEGRVAVADERENGVVRPEPQILTPGQQLAFPTWRDVELRRASVERVTSWRNGRVIFEDERLGDVIAEINRYSNRRLVLGDPGLAELRISGVFRTGSVSNFATALSASFPVETAADPSSNTLVVKRRTER